MKWSKQWVAAFMLLPAIYLTSCGSGENSSNKGGEISTQSPPPVDSNYFDTTSSSIRGGGTDEPGSVTTGSTIGTGGTGSESGNTGMSSSDKSPSSVTNETKLSSVKTPRSKTYNRSTGSYARKSASSVKKTTSTADELNRAPKQDKSPSAEIERMADTVATKSRSLWDTTAKKVGDFGDTAANHTHQMGDSSTMPMHNMKTSDRGTAGTVNSSNFLTADTSRKTSTIDTGINFTSSVFIPDQIRSNYAEIKMARMAIEKSQNDEVKQVARTLENDHNALLRELQTMAANSISGSDSVPTSENDMARQHIDMMKNLTGQEFDRQWLQHMHMMHDQKVQMFEQAETGNSIHDAELRIWVNKTLPALRKHREMLAQTLNSINK